MRTVSARKTRVEKLNNELAMEFASENHRRGVPSKPSGCRSYGLFLEEELLAVAIFCNSRTRAMQKRYTTELLRMAFKDDVRIQGGASKLIKAFIRSGPADFFTYQDLSGEQTDVYAHAGMEFLSESKEKRILVVDGKTSETAQDNREDWFSMEQAVRFGPDALIKTNFGEVFDETGKRLSNVELFLKAGYHLETVPGDRLYGWRNTEVSYYTYRIRSTDDEGFYIGRRAIRKANPSIDDCVLDKYMGSGGSKFRNWMNEVNPDSVYKEILGIYPNWEEALKAEKVAIGNLYQFDDNCKNTQAGGLGWASPGTWIQLDNCTVHGETLHRGDACAKCSAAKIFTEKDCSIHGKVVFRGEVCCKCSHSEKYENQSCEIHGEVVHRSNKCVTCINGSMITLRHCEDHGFVKHQGEVCSTCNAQVSISLRICSTHGYTRHQGNTCSTCNSSSAISLKLCAVHGESKHSGDHCMKCNSAAQYSVRVCPTHGETKFKGNTCTKCTVGKAVNMKACIIHGVTKHQGDVCNSCNAQKSISQKDCPKHGRATHQGAVCNRCNAEASISEKECSKHGLSKFQGDKCVKCRNGSLISERECSVHGPSKHRGTTCMKCSQVNRRKPEDVLAEAGFVPADVSNAVAAGEPLTVVAKRFGISKHHVKKFAALG